MFLWHVSGVSLDDTTLVIMVIPAIAGGLLAARVTWIFAPLAAVSAGALGAKLIHDGIGDTAGGPVTSVIHAGLATAAFALMTLGGSQRVARRGAAGARESSSRGVIALLALAVHRVAEVMMIGTAAATPGAAGTAVLAASATHSALEGSLTASTAAVHGMSRPVTTTWVVAAGAAPVAGYALHTRIDDLPGREALAAVTVGILGYVALRCFRLARTVLHLDVLLTLLCVGFVAVLLTRP